MGHMSATDITLIITTITTGLVSIIAAWKANSNINLSKVNNEKLNKVDNTATIIHELTNGSFQRMKEQLDEERRRNRQLNNIILEIVNLLPPGTADNLVNRVNIDDDEFNTRNDNITNKIRM